MIKINLLDQKKTFKAPVILGMDFSNLNIKMLVLVFIISYIPDMILLPKYKSEQKENQEKIKSLNKEYKKIRSEVKKNSNITEKLNAFNRQVEKLKKRSKQVDIILRKKRNPRLLLEKIARKTPEDLWFESLTIFSDSKIVIKGKGVSYRSIGDFIISGNEMGFFGKSLKLSSSATEEGQGKNNRLRVESFTIEGKIETFDPWGE